MEQRQQVQVAFQAGIQKAQMMHQVIQFGVHRSSAMPRVYVWQEMLQEQEENWLGKLTVEQREVTIWQERIKIG